MKKRIIAWLLDSANSCPPFQRNKFYAYKNYWLEKYGLLVGHDIQHIRKMCWKCDGTGLFRKNDPCWHCSKGVYSEFWVYLEKYSFCDRVFHKPIDRQYGSYRDHPVTIEGYIRKEPHWAHHEAWLWLLLIGSNSWQDFWKEFRSSCQYSYYPLPLTKLQRIVFWFRHDSPTPFRINRWVEFKSQKVRLWLHGPECLRLQNYDDEVPF